VTGGERLRWFMCTDIVGSTPLWERWPDEMQVALERHDALLAEAVARSGGHLFKHTGDGVLAAFGELADAVRAAVDAQVGMEDLMVAAEAPLEVRVGIDGGDVTRRGDDYFGLALNRANRIMDAGHGGQIVLSVDAVKELPDPGAQSLSLGTYRLKGVGRPVELYQLLHPRLGRSFPALRALNAQSGNLQPSERTLIGRADLLASLGHALAEPGLITLGGPGGVGKTSLAVAAAWDAINLAPDGAWFVDLIVAQRPSEVAEVLASTLELDRRPGSTLLQTLTDALGTRQMVIVLDNCEHVITGAADVARALIRAAPGLRVLATSRRYLDVPNERRIAVPPLEVPARNLTPSALARVPSVQLFIERAAERGTDLTVTADNADQLGELCDRLEGVPLALELAAARATVLTVQQMTAGLDQRFRLLADDSHLAERHQTMWATIAWSFDLLQTEDQDAFASVSVFDGGFDVEALASLVEVDLFDAVDIVSRLVSLNLVLVETFGEQKRYRLLESVREYTAEVLLGRGIDRPALVERHASHYRHFFSEAVQQLETDDERSVLDALDRERKNLRLLFDHDLVMRPGDAAQMPLSLWALWVGRNLIEEGLRWLERARDALPADHPLMARVLDDLASVVWTQGDDEYAERACKESMAAAALRDEPPPVTTLVRLATIEAARGRGDMAQELIEQAIAHLDAGLTDHALVSIRAVIGVTLAMAGDVARGVPLCEQGIEEARQRGPAMLASALFNSAICFMFTDVERGYETAMESLTVSLKVRSNSAASSAHFALGLAQMLRGERIESLDHTAIALANYRSTGALQQAPIAIEIVASQLRSSPSAAVRLISASSRLRTRLGRPGSPFEQALLGSLTADLRNRLGVEFQDAWAAGALLDFDAAIDEAIALAMDEISAETGVDDLTSLGEGLD